MSLGAPREHQAVDSLTGLPLRGAFLASVERALAAIGARSSAGALIYADIDGLAAINAALGRQAGDAVLVEFAKALVAALGQGALVARDSGDAFAVFLGDAELLFAKMAAGEAQNCAAVAGGAVGRAITASVGLAMFPADGRDAWSLLSAASRACRAARRKGGGSVALAAGLASPEGPELVLERLGSQVFPGRQKELEAFRARLESCRKSTGYLFIRGEAGIGKTRLLRELRAAARGQKLSCALESCRPSDLMRPYAPLVRALAAYADETLESREALLRGRSPQEVDDLVPLFERCGVPIWPGHAEREGAAAAKATATYAARGLVGLLESMARRGPVVLLFDCVNWIDRASLELFGLAARERAFGLLVCGAVNERELRDESGSPRPAAELCEMRGELPNVWELRPRRLTLEEAELVTESILGGAPRAEGFGRALYGLSAGNPLFHEGILRLQAMRMEAAEKSGRQGGELSVSPAGIPRTLDALLDATLTELGRDISEAAAAIAAAGRPVGVDELALALGRTEGETTYFVDELARLGLLEEAPPGSGLFTLASTRLGERAISLAQADFLDVVHSCYADAAKDIDPAEEAYHRRFSPDESQRARAEAAAAQAAAVFWRGPEGTQEEQRQVRARPEPSTQGLSPEGQSALGRFLDAFAKAIERAGASPDLDPAALPSTEELLAAFEEVVRGIGTLTISARESALRVNGASVQPAALASTSGAWEAAGLLGEAMRRSGIAVLSIAADARLDDIAAILPPLAGVSPPSDWTRFLDERRIDRIGIVPGVFPKRSGPRQPAASTRRIVRFDESGGAAAEGAEVREQARPGPQGPATGPDTAPCAPTPAKPPEPAASGGGAAAAAAEPPRGLDSLGPEKIVQIEGIPPGAEPIRFRDDSDARRLLEALDRLLDENERASVAAAVWRVLAAFELEEGEPRRRLVSFLEELEPRIWRTRLVEAYKPLEDTLARQLRHEKAPDLLVLLARSAARAMYAFLRAGEYARVERLGRILSSLGAKDQPAERAAACAEAFSALAKTDFFDIVLSDLASESPERSEGALGALKQIARAVQDRLVDILRTSADYRVRRCAAEALAAAGEEAGVAAIAILGPTTSEEEYERIVSVVDALGLEAEIAEEEVIQAINHASERVRRAGVSVASRLPSASILGILQRAINAGGALGALRAMEAVAELRLVDALPVVQKQIVDSQDATVIEAAVRAIGRMAGCPDTPILRAVRLLGTALNRLPQLADKEEAERATLTALWAASQYRIPEASALLESAKAHPSRKVSAFAARMLGVLGPADPRPGAKG